MTIVLAVTAAVAAAALLGAVVYLLVKLVRHDREATGIIQSLSDQREEDAATIADECRDHECTQAKLTRVEAERDKARAEVEEWKQHAVRALVPVAAALEEEKAHSDQLLESVQVWMGYAKAALILGARPTPELPAGERRAIEPPAALPSGDYLVEDKRLILQVDA